MENEYDDIVTLYSDDGTEIDFIEIAGIAYQHKYYAILQPVELLPGMSEDEGVVFEVTTDKDGEDSYTIVLDDDIIDHVFEEYSRLYDEAMNNNGDDDK